MKVLADLYWAPQGSSNISEVFDVRNVVPVALTLQYCGVLEIDTDF